MRRCATLSCLLLLSGCGFGHFLGDTITLPGANPNSPRGDSENMRRIRAQTVAIVPIETEPGNVWPGKEPPEPTLEDIQRQQNQQTDQLQKNAPKPTLPFTIPTPGAQPAPGLRAPGSPAPGGRASGSLAPGSAVLLPNGQQGTVTGGTNTFRTLTTPGGGGNSIIIPNGNGTSTVIGPNGSVTTVPTPR